METSDIEYFELELLIDAIRKRYGYDFGNFARASLKRRVESYIANNEIDRISSLISVILYDEKSFQNLLYAISVTTTEMFRDPWFFGTLREKILPFLSTFPYIRIWVAGCATGEEVYSLAIQLKEEELYQRCQIYATDFNNNALEKARNRIFSLRNIKKYHQNYLQAGCKGSLTDYYIADYDAAIFSPSLVERVTFANHNLATDSVFGEMHLILCRNVLIYFDRILQNRVLNLFRESLRHNGFLALGSRETLDFSEVSEQFIQFTENERIYQLKKRADGIAPELIEKER